MCVHSVKLLLLYHVFSHLFICVPQKEEEEYATKVIHYFCLGLFTLPAGKTLRTFLADKLSCDPMRITKRFAGVSSLRKKIRSSCGKSKLTSQEIEEARVEIGRLEERLMLMFGRRSGAVLPPTKTPASIGGSVTSSPQDSNTSCAPATSGCLGSGAINPNHMTNAQDLFAYYNAQLAAAATNPAASLPFGAAPPSNTAATHLHQYASAPVTAPAAAFPQLLKVPSAAPAISLQAMLSNNNLVQPSK